MSIRGGSLRALARTAVAKPRPTVLATFGRQGYASSSRIVPLASLYSRAVPISIPARRSLSTATSRQQQEQEDEHDGPEDPEELKKPLGERLKALLKKYGRHALIVYLLLSAVDLSMVFAVVHLLGADQIGKVQDVAVNKYREWRYGVSEAYEMHDAAEKQKAQDEAEEAAKFASLSTAEKKKEASAPWYSNKLLWTEFALAYGIHKTALLPVRAGLTLAWTPKLVRWLTSRGWIGKGGVSRAAAHASDKVKDARGRVKDIAARARQGGS